MLNIPKAVFPYNITSEIFFTDRRTFHVDHPLYIMKGGFGSAKGDGRII